MVYKSKADWLVQLSLDATSAKNLRHCLENLDDAHDVIDICLRARSANCDVIRAVLGYAMERLASHKTCDGDRSEKVG